MVADVGSKGFCQGRRIGRLEDRLAKLSEDLLPRRRETSTLLRRLECLEHELGREYDKGLSESSPENSAPFGGD
ncbi:hypothetical protein SLA2020_262180 [Shorea laevis]